MISTLLQAELKLCCLLQGLSLGIGLAGTVVSAISFVTCWLRPVGSIHVKTVDEAAPEALSYFLLSSIIIAAAIVTYYVFFRHPFVKRHLRPQGESPAPISLLLCIPWALITLIMTVIVCYPRTGSLHPSIGTSQHILPPCC